MLIGVFFLYQDTCHTLEPSADGDGRVGNMAADMQARRRLLSGEWASGTAGTRLASTRGKAACLRDPRDG